MFHHHVFPRCGWSYVMHGTDILLFCMKSSRYILPLHEGIKICQSKEHVFRQIMLWLQEEVLSSFSLRAWSCAYFLLHVSRQADIKRWMWKVLTPIRLKKWLTTFWRKMAFNFQWMKIDQIQDFFSFIMHLFKLSCVRVVSSHLSNFQQWSSK